MHDYSTSIGQAKTKNVCSTGGSVISSTIWSPKSLGIRDLIPEAISTHLLNMFEIRWTPSVKRLTFFLHLKSLTIWEIFKMEVPPRHPILIIYSNIPAIFGIPHLRQQPFNSPFVSLFHHHLVYWPIWLRLIDTCTKTSRCNPPNASASGVHSVNAKPWRSLAIKAVADGRCPRSPWQHPGGDGEYHNYWTISKLMI